MRLSKITNTLANTRQSQLSERERERELSRLVLALFLLFLTPLAVALAPLARLVKGGHRYESLPTRVSPWRVWAHTRLGLAVVTANQASTQACKQAPAPLAPLLTACTSRIKEGTLVPAGLVTNHSGFLPSQSAEGFVLLYKWFSVVWNRR